MPKTFAQCCVFCYVIQVNLIIFYIKHKTKLWVRLCLVSSPKSCVIGPGLGLGTGLDQENQDGEEEPVVMVAPRSNHRAFSTLPSVDSAVESWDGSNMDSSFTMPGRNLSSDL